MNLFGRLLQNQWRSYSKKGRSCVMGQCLRISFSTEVSKHFLENFVQKNAKKLALEGIAQIVDAEHIQIVACGSKENLDHFLDVLHKGESKVKLHDIAVEPFLKGKDYRGVFRVIE